MFNIKTQSGISWHYQQAEEGKNTLLFIHGWSFDSNIWINQWDLKNEYRIITLDLPGHGFSRYNKNIDIIEELHHRFGMGNLTIIGHSLGGFLALQLSQVYPDLVKNLILISSPVKFIKSKDYDFGLSKEEVEKLRKFITENYPGYLLIFMRWLFTDAERKQDNFKQIWHNLEKREVWPSKEALQSYLSFIEEGDLRSGLEKVKADVLIIGGDKDPICPLNSLYYLSEKIKGSKVEFFKDCGHLPFLTHPERFNKLVKEFLDK